MSDDSLTATLRAIARYASHPEHWARPVTRLTILDLVDTALAQRAAERARLTERLDCGAPTCRLSPPCRQHLLAALDAARARTP